MPPFKSFLGSGNDSRVKNFLKGSDGMDNPENSKIQENVTIGLKYKMRSKSPIIGPNAFIRSNTVIYDDVEIGEEFKTGHGVVIREKTKIGDNVLIGTNSVIEGQCTIGSNVSIQSNVYLPVKTIIEDYVFIGPCACLTNDKYPIRIDFELKGPIIRKGASIGANSTFLSGVEIGEGAMVAAGAIVTHDVPKYYLAMGAPSQDKTTPQTSKNIK